MKARTFSAIPGIGSSYPVAGAVPAAKAAGARIVIVNAEPTPFDDMADAVLRRPIGEILPALCGRAGFTKGILET